MDNLKKSLYFNEVIIASIALLLRCVAFRPEKDREVFFLVNNLESLLLHGNEDFLILKREEKVKSKRIWHEKVWKNFLECI